MSHTSECQKAIRTVPVFYGNSQPQGQKERVLVSFPACQQVEITAWKMFLTSTSAQKQSLFKSLYLRFEGIVYNAYWKRNAS